MEKIKLQKHQIEAIHSIKKALEKGQKRMLIDMPTGCGKEIVLAKTVETINELNLGKILILTSTVSIRKQIEYILVEHTNVSHIDNGNVLVENIQKIFKNPQDHIFEYEFTIFYDTIISEHTYSLFANKEKTMIVFSNKDTLNTTNSPKMFKSEDVVFSYTFEDAVYDGILTPAMDTEALGYAVDAFTKHLLEQFKCDFIKSDYTTNNQVWDLIAQKGNQKIFVECKAYKSQVISPSSANSLLNTIVMKKLKQGISKKDIVLLVVFSSIPSFQKNIIYERYGIIVWDIENLVFYSKDNPSLLKKLSQITYFPIDHIEGRPSEEAKIFDLKEFISEDNIIHEVENEDNKTLELIQRLNNCKPGKTYSSEYENICEEILRTLFESNYFNRLTNQHKTHDEHFRMDLIGSLKINQKNEDSMHPLWNMLVQHYNSHFVVFEFKNYAKEIDQNLIYITEKYLFDAALRNVAIIISRKGFSKSAKFAAEGCLKEHGKLILNITNEDLINMLESNSNEAADYLLGKLEDFLMGISK